jgi:hypothetical protein
VRCAPHRARRSGSRRSEARRRECGAPRLTAAARRAPPLGARREGRAAASRVAAHTNPHINAPTPFPRPPSPSAVCEWRAPPRAPRDPRAARVCQGSLRCPRLLSPEPRRSFTPWHALMSPLWNPGAPPERARPASPLAPAPAGAARVAAACSAFACGQPPLRLPSQPAPALALDKMMPLYLAPRPAPRRAPAARLPERGGARARAPSCRGRAAAIARHLTPPQLPLPLKPPPNPIPLRSWGHPALAILKRLPGPARPALQPNAHLALRLPAPLFLTT